MFRQWQGQFLTRRGVGEGTTEHCLFGEKLALAFSLIDRNFILDSGGLDLQVRVQSRPSPSRAESTAIRVRAEPSPGKIGLESGLESESGLGDSSSGH